MTSQLSALLDRRATFVERWHHRPASIRESVAEHQWSVAVLSYQIAFLLNDPEIDVSTCVLFAMFHDMAEVVTGDMPTTFKVNPDVRERWDRWEREATDQLFLDVADDLADSMRALVNQDVDENGTGPAERGIVKLADKLSAYAFAKQEVDKGNTPFREIVRNAARLSLAAGRAAPWWEALCEEVPDLLDELTEAAGERTSLMAVPAR